MRHLLPLMLLAIALLTGCGEPIRLNPGARVPVYHVSAQWLAAKWPKADHPGIYHGGELVGLYVPSPTSIYIVPGHDLILAHEVGHLAEDCGGSYRDALRSISTPGFDLFQDL